MSPDLRLKRIILFIGHRDSLHSLSLSSPLCILPSLRSKWRPCRFARGSAAPQVTSTRANETLHQNHIQRGGAVQLCSARGFKLATCDINDQALLCFMDVLRAICSCTLRLDLCAWVYLYHSCCRRASRFALTDWCLYSPIVEIQLPFEDIKRVFLMSVISFKKYLIKGQAGAGCEEGQSFVQACVWVHHTCLISHKTIL